MIEELDCVVLTRDIPEKKLKAGDVGTVVMVFNDGEAFDVEFMTLDGDTFALETLMAADLRTASLAASRSPTPARWPEPRRRP